MRFENTFNHLGFAVSGPVLSSNQIQLDAMCSGFSSSVSNPLNTMPMTAASLSSQVFKFASLSLGAGRWISEAVSLLGEAAVFRTSSWALSERRSQDSLLDLRSYARTVMDLGIFKSLHALLPAQNIFLRNGVQATGMMTAEEVASSLGWLEGSRENTAFRFAHAFASSIEMEMGMGLASFASGHRMEVLRRNMEGAARVYSEGTRIQNNNFSFAEGEILLMHSPYRSGKVKEAKSPSDLHVRLLELETIEVRAFQEHDLTRLWRIFTEVKNKALNPAGNTERERELLRYRAAKALLRVADLFMQRGGDKGQMEVSLADPEFEKSLMRKYLDFEKSENPVKNPGTAGQHLRDYLNARPWSREDLEMETDWPNLQSHEMDGLRHIYELDRQSKGLAALSTTRLWSRLVQFREIALRPPSCRSLEERERVRYMAVLCLLKTVNVFHERAETSPSYLKDSEALLSNLALESRFASDYLHHEIAFNSQNSALKNKVLNFEGWAESNGDMFGSAYNLGIIILASGITLHQIINLWNIPVNMNMTGKIITLGAMMVGGTFSGFMMSVLFSNVLSRISVRLISEIEDMKYKHTSCSHQSLRDYLLGKPWQEIEDIAQANARIAPLEAAMKKRELREEDMLSEVGVDKFKK